jgi:hypothetical protein
MSLFESASLVITPNGTKASKLYSIIPTDGSGDLTVTRATTATRVNASGLIESVANNVPRIDYTNGSCPSILVEPQRTNLLTYSEGNLATYDVSDNCTNASTSISGFSNSIQVPSTGLTYFYKTAITTLSQVYTISCFIKMDDNSVPVLGANSSLGNLSFVAKGNIAPDNLKVTLVGNNIYRISATAVGNGIPVFFGIVRYSSQTLKSFKISGIQLEAGSDATSYIPTTAASVTRNADVISKTGISSLIGQTEGTLYVEIKAIADDNAEKHITISDGTNANRIDLFYGFYGTGKIYYEVRAANSVQGGLLSGNLSVTSMNKIACVYKTNRFELWINGNKVAQDLIGNTFSGSTLSKLETSLPNGTNRFFGNIKSIVLYKTALTDQQCIDLTTP